MTVPFPSPAFGVDAPIRGHGLAVAARRVGGATVAHGPARDPGDVYRALAPAVLGYLRGSGVEDPEDTLGEVFVHVVRDLHRFRGDDDGLRRWVFTIAHRRLVDARRRAARRPRPSSEPVPETPAPPPGDPIDAELVEALARLTPDQREVVVLRFVADLPVEAVARMTRRSSGAVRALQHRALEALSGLLGAGAGAGAGTAA
jgi:RNA polymerase sigma factor (sigma-70 family)